MKMDWNLVYGMNVLNDQLRERSARMRLGYRNVHQRQLNHHIWSFGSGTKPADQIRIHREEKVIFPCAFSLDHRPLLNRNKSGVPAAIQCSL